MNKEERITQINRVKELHGAKKDNYHAFKKLIEIYRDIDVNDIEETVDMETESREGAYGGGILRLLTGFGSQVSCSLCQAISAEQPRDCDRCIYGILELFGYIKKTETGVVPCLTDSWFAIENYRNHPDEKWTKENSKELVNRVHQRANFMEQCLENYEHLLE